MKLEFDLDEQQTKPASLLDYQRIAIAVGDGAPVAISKTAMSLMRYRGEDIIAVIDAANAGKSAQEVYRLGGTIPIVASLSDVPDTDAIFVGIAPAGGVLPQSIRSVIAQGVDKGIDIVSGLHQFLIDDSELVAAARLSGSRLIDVRRNQYKKTARGTGFREGCLRIHTVGHDCAVGKMVVTLELERELKQRGVDAQFLATGQTGIMVSGRGVPVDCVVSDFVNGAVEELVFQNEDHEILLIEGQGSATHPAFSAVTLGLLHGCAPQGLILCYEVGRTVTMDYPHVPLMPLEYLRHLYETIGSVRIPTKVIGIAMNSRYVTAEQAEAEKKLVEESMGLPVCDVYRDGPTKLADAVLKLKKELFA
ncbi:MAG TPA: DUF1611 domain-containing protein [Planctomicrobium sp.]|nr:DUF1611 domain-containing protein [Planctomicrobium sp.]